MKLNSTNRSTLKGITAIIIVIIALMYMMPPATKKSMYQLAPKGISIKSLSESSIFGLNRSADCLAGPKKDSDFYNIDVQGICNGQKMVSDQASYEINDGIGGVLI
jgi:hypothetical protein